MPLSVPGRKSDRLAACFCGALVLVCAGPASAQTAESPPSADTVPRTASGEPIPEPTDGLKRLPVDAFRPEPDFGVRYRTLFRDTGAPYINDLRPVHIQPSAEIGDVEGRINLGIPNFRGTFPLLQRGFEPEKADIKIGPFFFKVHALSAAVLASDNVDHSETDKQSDVIAIARVGGTLTAQLTEGLHISVSGNFVWLPTKGEFGISGYGLFAPYSLGLEGIPALESQISWDTMAAGWNVLFTDDFRLSLGRFSDSTRDDEELFEGGQFNEVDKAGRYTFRAPRPQQENNRFNRQDTDVNVSYFSNILGVTTERLLAGPVRLRIHAFHEDLWYNQGSRGEPDLRDATDTSELPTTRDGVTFEAISERDNLRFNPYVTGRMVETDRSNGFTEEIRLGLRGPITDQLHLDANVGVFHRDDSGSTRFVWGLELRHDAGPFTQESLIGGSDYGEFTQELTTHLTYRIRQILGPKNVAQVYASVAHVDDLLNGVYTRDEFRAGIRDDWYLGPRTTLRSAFLYSMLTHGTTLGDRQTYTMRLEVIYHFTDTLFSRVLLEHHTRDSDTPNDSYDENLILVSLTKYFE